MARQISKAHEVGGAHVQSLQSAPRTDRRNLAAARLLATAGELFYRHGFHAVGVEQIVRDAGVTKPTLYHHYHSKAELAAAYVSELSAAVFARLDAIARRYPGAPVQQLEAIVDDAANRLAAPRFRGDPLTNLATELTDPEHPVRRVAEGHAAGVRARLTGLAAEAGLDAPEELADGLLLLLEGAAAARHMADAAGPTHALRPVAQTLIAAHLPLWPAPRELA